MLNSEGLIVQFTGVLLYSLGGHEAHNSAAFKIHSIHSLSGGAWRWHINIFNIIATLFRVGAVRIWTIHHFRPNRSFAVRFVPGLTIFVRPVASRVIIVIHQRPRTSQDLPGLPRTPPNNQGTGSICGALAGQSSAVHHDGYRLGPFTKARALALRASSAARFLLEYFSPQRAGHKRILRHSAIRTIIRLYTSKHGPISYCDCYCAYSTYLNGSKFVWPSYPVSVMSWPR